MGMGLFGSTSRSTTEQTTITDIDTTEAAVQADQSVVTAGRENIVGGEGSQVVGGFGSSIRNTYSDQGAIEEAFGFASGALSETIRGFETLVSTSEGQTSAFKELAMGAQNTAATIAANQSESGADALKNAAIMGSGGRVIDTKILVVGAVVLLGLVYFMRKGK